MASSKVCFQLGHMIAATTHQTKKRKTVILLQDRATRPHSPGSLGPRSVANGNGKTLRAFFLPVACQIPVGMTWALVQVDFRRYGGTHARPKPTFYQTYSQDIVEWNLSPGGETIQAW